MGVADCKDLRVYRLAFDSAMEIFDRSKSFLSEEKYSSCDRVREDLAEYFTNAAVS